MLVDCCDRASKLIVAATLSASLAATAGVYAGELSSQGVQPATAVAPAIPPDGAPRGAVRFEPRETRVGDRVVQRLGLQLTITTKIVQSGQVAHESTDDVRRQQQRTVDVLDVADGRAVKARATFEVSRRQAPDQADASQFVALPIEGKTYLMARDGDTVTVTDADGAIPPLEEYTLATESLEGVGKPNPLSVVLAGREIAIGQALVVPRDLAQALLGFGSPELANIHRFELVLDRVAAPAEPAGSQLAVFRAIIEVKPESAETAAIMLQGEMAVDPMGCRLAAVDLAGPVRVSTIERTQLGSYQYSMSGEFRVAIRSEYGSHIK